MTYQWTDMGNQLHKQVCVNLSDMIKCEKSSHICDLENLKYNMQSGWGETTWNFTFQKVFIF